MTPRVFWPTVVAAFLVLALVSRWLVSSENYPVVLATLAATFAGACVGALILLVLRISPNALMAATLGRSAVSIAGVVMVWLLMEPPVKPLLGALALGYCVFLAIETALAYSVNQAKIG